MHESIRTAPTAAAPLSRARILDEVRQLTGVRELRVRINGPDDKMIPGIERMIRERRLKLYGCD